MDEEKNGTTKNLASPGREARAVLTFFHSRTQPAFRRKEEEIEVEEQIPLMHDAGIVR